MAKIISYVTAAARLATPAMPTDPLRANPARLWLEQRKVGASRNGCHARRLAPRRAPRR